MQAAWEAPSLLPRMPLPPPPWTRPHRSPCFDLWRPALWPWAAPAGTSPPAPACPLALSPPFPPAAPPLLARVSPFAPLGLCGRTPPAPRARPSPLLRCAAVFERPFPAVCAAAPARRPFICADSMGSLCPAWPSRLSALAPVSCSVRAVSHRCPRRLCLQSSVLRVSAPCALPSVAFTRFCRPFPRPLRRPVRLPSRAPYPLPAPKGKEAFVRPHKAFFSRPRSAPFALPRFAPGAFPGRLPRSALCRSPGPSCHPGLPTVPRPPPSPSPLRQTAGEGGKRKRPLFPFGKKKSYKTTKIS